MMAIYETPAAQYHGRSMSRKRSRKTVSVFRGTNRDQGSRAALGVVQDVADARDRLRSRLREAQAWGDPEPGQIMAVSGDWIQPRVGLGKHTVASVLAEMTAGAELIAPAGPGKYGPPDTVYAVFGGELRRVSLNEDRGSNEIRGHVSVWTEIPADVRQDVMVLAHHAAVKAALAARVAVPADVLADYPDLAPGAPTHGPVKVPMDE
jgi:hypothetical protein